MGKVKYFGGICAAGSGMRFGGETPKQFLEANGKPLLSYSVEAMLKCSEIEKIFVAVPGEYTDRCRELYPDERIMITPGGSNRAETVALLSRLALSVGAENDIMITHDAARPLVSPETFVRCAAAAEEYGASGAALPASDTVFRCGKDGFITDAPPREEMFLAQTPQCFRLGLFKKIWQSVSDEEKRTATDVCGMFFRAGVRVKMVEGDVNGGKVTFRDDIKRLFVEG